MTTAQIIRMCQARRVGKDLSPPSSGQYLRWPSLLEIKKPPPATRLAATGVGAPGGSRDGGAPAEKEKTRQAGTWFLSRIGKMWHKYDDKRTSRGIQRQAKSLSSFGKATQAIGAAAASCSGGTGWSGGTGKGEIPA